jgi:lipopolysaccharide transport system permease protein
MGARRHVISAQQATRFPDLRELWDFREVLWILTLRDVRIRYKQTAIGIAWALIQPLMTMVVFTLIFGRLGKLPSEGLPYPVFVLTALLPWQLFARALTAGSGSMVTMGGMMAKIYFPRLIAPLSSVLSGVIDFVIAFSLLIALMLYYGTWPGPQIVYAPLFILLALAAAFSVALWLSAINTEYRDVQHAMPFVTQIWLFLTPVIYPVAMIPEKWKWLYVLNPMVSVVEGFRWTLVGGKTPELWVLLASSASVIGLSLGGLFYFARFEKKFVDRL